MIRSHSVTLTLISAVLGTGLLVPIRSNAIAYSPTPAPETSVFPAQDLLIAQLGFTVQGVRPSRDRVGGIARGDCGADLADSELVALLSSYGSDETDTDQVQVEYTVSDHPAFFVYIPENKAHSMQFLLMNEAQDQELYSVSLTPPTQAGVVGIQLPADLPPLEVGSYYYWAVSLVCDPNGIDNSGNLIVDGWVQRIEESPELQAELARLEPRDRPAAYASAGIWQDTLASLAELRLQNPEDPTLLADWVNLLASVNLRDIASAPIMEESQLVEE